MNFLRRRFAPTCQTCKHFGTSTLLGGDKHFSVCTNTPMNLPDGNESPPLPVDGLRVFTDDPYTGYWIRVGPEFGCIHHETKQ